MSYSASEKLLDVIDDQKIGFNTKKLCILTNTEFFYYADPKAHGSVKRVSLQDVQAVKRDHNSKGFQFEIITHQKTETFAADSLELCQRWLKAIQSTLLTTRRTSVTSTGSGSSEGLKSPLSKFGGHSYEEVDLGKVGQPVLSGQNSVKSPTSRTSLTHSYEVVDLDPADKPRVPRGSRAPCTTVDKVGGPRGTKAPPQPVNNRPPVLNNRPPATNKTPPKELDLSAVYSEPFKGKGTTKDLPPISPKPAKPSAQTRGTCMTVDAQGGPPGTQLPQAPSSNTQNGTVDNAPVYSEAMSPKRSDLYLDAKKQKAERGRGGDVPSGTGDYSSTYSTSTQPDGALYSEVGDVVVKRDGGQTHSGIYSLAKDVKGDNSSTAILHTTAEDVYSDAESCRQADTSSASSANPASPSPNSSSAPVTVSDGLHAPADPSISQNTLHTRPGTGSDPERKGDARSSIPNVSVADSPPAARASDTEKVADVNSNTIRVPALRHGPETRHQAITKLDQFLSTCNNSPSTAQS